MRFFDDPLMRRELSGVARRWQTFVARGVVGALIAWVVYYLWDRVDSGYEYLGTSYLATLAREVFILYFAGQMVFLPLLAVSAAGDLIPKEVRNGTLGLLFLTPLTPWRIAAGKWKAAMAQVVLILLAGGPVAAICVFLGGIGAWDIVWGAVLPLASAAFAASLALALSTMFRTTAMTVIVSILALLAGVFVPVFMMVQSRDGLELLVLVHPVFAAVVTVEPRLAQSPELADYAWIAASLSALLGAWALLALAAGRLPDRAQLLPGPSAISRLMARLDSFYESINVGQRRFLVGSGEVWQSRALLWKELRTRTAGKLRHAVRIAVVLLLLGVIPFSSPGRDAKILLLGAASGLLLLQAVVAGLSLFVHEKEGRQWDVLLSTPLRPRDIVASKLLGGLPALGPTAAVGGLFLATLSWLNGGGVLGWAVYAGPLALFTVFAYVLSAACSLRCRTHRGAFMLSLGLLLGILAGLPVGVEIFDSLPFRWLSSRDVLPWSSPFWYLDFVGDRLYGYWGTSWWDTVGLEYLPHYGVLYVGATGVLLGWMLARFDRLAGRA